MERLTPEMPKNSTEESSLKAHVVRHGPSSYRQPEWEDVKTADDLNTLGRYEDDTKTPEEIQEGKEKAVQKVKESAEKIAAEIDPSEEVIIWSSPTGRTLETARIISETLEEKGINLRKKGISEDYGIKTFKKLGEVENFEWTNFEPLMSGGEVNFEGNTFSIDKSLSNPNDMGYPEYFTSDASKEIPDEVKAQWPKEYVDYIEKFESFASVSRRMAETLKKLKQVSDKKYRVIIVTHDAVAGQLVKTFSNDELSGINPGDFLSLEKKDGKLVVTRVGDVTEGDSETDVSEL